MQEDKQDETAAEAATQDNGAAPPAEPQSPEELAVALEDARAESTSHWERYLRSAAEIENLRRRNARDVENAHKFAVERFAADLLAVSDSLDMGLAAADDNAAAAMLREGMEATRKQLQQAFERHGIQSIEPLGEPFDPELHEAMTVQPTEEMAPDHVLTVVQRGFLLNGRLLRAARVIVSAAPG